MSQLRSLLVSSAKKPILLTELTTISLKRAQGNLIVETQGVTYNVKFKSTDRVYSARSEGGDYFENANLAELKKELKSDATPSINCAVAVEGKVVGHILNQHNLFFYRPANSKGELDTERLCDPDDVLEKLNAQNIGIYTKLK